LRCRSRRQCPWNCRLRKISASFQRIDQSRERRFAAPLQAPRPAGPVMGGNAILRRGGRKKTARMVVRGGGRRPSAWGLRQAQRRQESDARGARPSRKRCRWLASPRMELWQSTYAKQQAHLQVTTAHTRPARGVFDPRTGRVGTPRLCPPSRRRAPINQPRLTLHGQGSPWRHRTGLAAAPSLEHFRPTIQYGQLLTDRLARIKSHSPLGEAVLPTSAPASAPFPMNTPPRNQSRSAPKGLRAEGGKIIFRVGGVIATPVAAALGSARGTPGALRLVAPHQVWELIRERVFAGALIRPWVLFGRFAKMPAERNLHSAAAAMGRENAKSLKSSPPGPAAAPPEMLYSAIFCHPPPRLIYPGQEICLDQFRIVEPVPCLAAGCELFACGQSRRWGCLR